MTDRVVLQHHGMLLELIPDFGGRVARLSLDGVDVLVPLGSDTFDPVRWPRAGAYPMVPYHNRIEDGRLAVVGKVYEIAPHPDALPHSLHGPAQRERWRLVFQSDHHATLELVRAADENWPWAFQVRQVFALRPDGLELSLSVTNKSNMKMPAGLGWHPYVAGCLDVAHDAEFVWPLRPDYLPRGTRSSIQHHHPAPVTGTEYLSCWSHLNLKTASGLDVDLSVTPVMSHLVLHKGDGDYVCVEPVSHLANGFNLHERGVLGTGTRTLDPDEDLSATISMTIRGRSEAAR
ncbi:hypothetical protein [Devosia sp. LjRoot3]|uniref:aldose epimerase family protein n=1 Tax=Devosia sp. LjRoot3 TaxID=3342319 RepID=UPI003ECD3A2D